MSDDNDNNDRMESIHNDQDSSDATDPVVNSPPRIRQQGQQRRSRSRRQLAISSPHRRQQQQRRRQSQDAAQQPRRRRGLLRGLRRDDEEKRAVELTRRLEYGAEMLLEKLFAFLSQLPEILEDDGSDPLATFPANIVELQQQGVTLPAAAVAWLSSQLYPEPWKEEEKSATRKKPTSSHDDAEDECCSLVTSVPKHSRRPHTTSNNIAPWLGGVALRDRLSLLRFLLPRVRMIRINRQAWPPELPKDTNRQSSQRNTTPSTPPRRPPSDLNCSTISSVNSALTMEEGIFATQNTTADYSQSPRAAFLEYMQKLEVSPNVDLRVFPNTQVLILESVPPSWISNLHQLHGLQVLRMDRAAVYNLPAFMFTKRQWQLSAESISRRMLYQHLTHLRLDHCQLNEMSGLSACLAKLPSVQYLSLQHNQIHNERTALKGLERMPRLTTLDLRYNCLTNLPRANLYLGGQLHTLKLSHNQITTTKGGLDKCYALRELWLDGNQVHDLYQVSGLARLPELQVLRLYNNPVTTLGDPHFDPGWKVQLWTWFQEARRAPAPQELPALIDVASVGVGGAVSLKLGMPTEQDWQQVVTEAFSNVVQPAAVGTEVTAAGPEHGITPASATTNISFFSAQTPSAHSVSTLSFSSPTQTRRVTKKSKTRRAVIGNAISGTSLRGKKMIKPKTRRGAAAGKSALSNTSQQGQRGSESTSGQTIAFSVQDVLASLQEPIPVKDSDKVESIETVFEEDLLAEDSRSLHENGNERDTLLDKNSFDESENAFNPFAAYDKVKQGIASNDADEAGKDELSDTEKKEELEGRKDSHLETRDGNSANGPEEAVNRSRGDDADSNKSETPEKCSTDDPPTPVQSRSVEEKEDRIFPKTATVKLHKQVPPNVLSVLDCDWDELVKRASQGKIPDGLIKSPVLALEHSASAVTLETRNGVAKVFSEEAAELLPVDTKECASQQPPSVVQSSDSLSASNPADTFSVRLPNTLPQHIWNDDNSVLSSLGASREDFAPVGASKFQMAEENSFYDGPDYCREMKVTENLALYFEEFVFTTSAPTVPQGVLQELEADHDDWQSVTLYFPRIQLWPDDRRRLERLLLSSSTQDPDWAENREKFKRLWEDDVVPCGKPSLKRLPPNRRIRLGFHGDQLFEGPDLDAYSECRKVLLCLSSKAFYVILREDSVTANHKAQAKQRRFPLPIDDGLFFRDAPWPHSVARHSLLDLEAICIGFEFQRLTLRFRNPAVPKSDPFVYVVLSSNKKSTVKILQELQKAARELKDANITLASEKAPIAIENDSNDVFDRLTAAVAPDILGTVLHYQILQQYWRRGDRGTVRRSCVVTETRILLLDEDYTADGHNLSDITVHRDNMADVRYRKVDEAGLKQVTEVQAAGADPRAITIIISGPSTLSRTHRWRLLCRDREGAERLVDDVRKAVANFDDAETLNSSFAR